MPTLVGLCLFVPLFEPPAKTVDITLLIFGGIILSFMVAGLAAAAADLFVELLPGFRRRLEDYRAERGWVNGNWNIGRLEAHMTKDELEAADLIGSYIISTKIITFYLLAYFLVNLVWLAFGLYDAATAAGGATEFWRTVWGVRTPIVGGWLLSTVVILVAAPASIVFLLADYLGKYGQLFLRGGWYDNMAAKYHAEKGDIARHVWGRVTEKKDGKTEGVCGLEVTLSAGGQAVGGPAETDKDGYFQHEDAFAKCRAGYELKVAQTYEEKTAAPVLTTKYSVTVVAPASLTVTSLEGKVQPDVLISVVRVKTKVNGAFMPAAGRAAGGGANNADAAPPAGEQGTEAEHNSSAGQTPVREVIAEPPPVEDPLKPATVTEAAAAEEEVVVFEAAETTRGVPTDVGGAKGDETPGGNKAGS